MLLALVYLACMTTASLGEEKKEDQEEMCMQCNCEAVTSSLSCLSDAWQSLTCNLSHTDTCPGTFTLDRGYMFAERSKLNFNLALILSEESVISLSWHWTKNPGWKMLAKALRLMNGSSFREAILVAMTMFTSRWSTKMLLKVVKMVKKEWTKNLEAWKLALSCNLGFLPQVLETGPKSQNQNLTGEKPVLQLR